MREKNNSNSQNINNTSVQKRELVTCQIAHPELRAHHPTSHSFQCLGTSITPASWAPHSVPHSYSTRRNHFFPQETLFPCPSNEMRLCRITSGSWPCISWLLQKLPLSWLEPGYKPSNINCSTSSENLIHRVQKRLQQSPVHPSAEWYNT